MNENSSKLVIKKKYQKRIKNFKDMILKSQLRQDKRFDRIAASMGLSEEESQILWDHVYNDTEWTVEMEGAE
jgi:hypothetical protein